MNRSSLFARARSSLSRHGAIVGVLIVGVTLTSVSAVTTRSDVLQAAHDVTDRRALFVSTAVRVSVENLMTETSAAAGLFATSDDVREEEFAQFVRTAGRNSGSVGTVYIPQVAEDDWASLLAAAGKDFTPFRFDRFGAAIPTSGMSTKWPVLYAVGEPTGSSLRGFDAASDPVWAELLARTQEQQRTSISGPTQLFGVPGDWGFIAASPILDHQRVTGYTAAVARLSGLVEAELEDSLTQVIQWHVRDLTDGTPGFASPDPFRRTLTLNLGGRTWEVDVIPTDEARDDLLGNGVARQVILGLAVTLAAAVATHFAINATRTRRETDHLRWVAGEKDDFLTALSHELRTPLTVVVGMSDILEEATLSSNPEIREYVQLINQEGHALARLVDDLLLLGRLDAEVLPMLPEDVDVEWEVERITNEFTLPESTQLTVEGSGVAWADPLRLRHIIRHLYANAIRYGGDNVTIQIVQRDRETAVLVCDNGPGVAEDRLRGLFISSRGTKDTPGGHASLGLGLRVSSRLADALGGTLSYRRQDHTTIFELRLPSVRTFDGAARQAAVSRRQSLDINGTR